MSPHAPVPVAPPDGAAGTHAGGMALPGALVVGGDHPGLAIARSLAPRGVPVVVIDDQLCVSSWSRHVRKVVRVADLRDPVRTVDAVLEVGERLGLEGWVLFPTRDETVAAIAQHRDRLAARYRLTTAAWDTVRWAWDKAQTYEMAQRLGIPVPRTWSPRDRDELAALAPRLPLAIKPAIKEHFFYATGAKAWRADTPAELEARYTEAARSLPPGEILLQEIIPGDGTRQWSYCAFFKDGEGHSVLVARRLRQHPREFGRAATYVETIDSPEVEALATRFLRAIDYRGLVEVEFKEDPRDGAFKLLDVNARAWGFHGLGQAVGVDFPFLQYADCAGLALPPRSRAPAGQGWLRLLPDLAVAASDLSGGHLAPRAYWSSLRSTRVESVFAARDPLPSLAEVALLPYLVARKYGPRMRGRG